MTVECSSASCHYAKYAFSIGRIVQGAVLQAKGIKDCLTMALPNQHVIQKVQILSTKYM